MQIFFGEFVFKLVDRASCTQCDSRIRLLPDEKAIESVKPRMVFTRLGSRSGRFQASAQLTPCPSIQL